MAASGGGAVAVGAAWRILRSVTTATIRNSKALRAKVTSARESIQTFTQQDFLPNIIAKRVPVFSRNVPRNTARRGWTSSPHHNVVASLRRYMTTTPGSAGPRFQRSKFPSSNTARLVAQGSGRAPFAGPLRPNLTGGTLPRTANGYAFGGGSGGARFFSHGPAAPAEVVNQVSLAVRAFFLSGSKAHFDGVNARGEHRFTTLSKEQVIVSKKVNNGIPAFTPGSYIDFHLLPTVTAFTPPPTVSTELATSVADRTVVGDKFSSTTLHGDRILADLATDLSRAYKALTAIDTDLRKLAAIGDLPIMLVNQTLLRVRFPGVDGETLERLCHDIGIEMGVVHEDEDYDCVSPDPPLHEEKSYMPRQQQARYALPESDSEQAFRGRGRVSPSANLSEYSISLGSSDLNDAFLYENGQVSIDQELDWMSDVFTKTTSSRISKKSDRPRPKGGANIPPCNVESIYRFIGECDAARPRFTS